MSTSSVSAFAKPGTQLFSIFHSGFRCRIPQVVFALVVLVLATSSGAQTSNSSFMIRIYEDEVNLSYPGVTVLNCAVVLPNGLLHLETRRKELPQVRAILSVYEQPLTSNQLATLDSIIKDEQIMKLPKFEQPTRPLPIPYAQMFAATIPGSTGLRSVGYFDIQRDGQVPAPATTVPEEMRERWKQSKVALRPLVSWLHELERVPLPKTGKTSELCVSDGKR